MISTKKSKTICSLHIANILEQVDNAIHLGIWHDANISVDQRISERCQQARHKLFTMTSIGVHPQGRNPLVAASLHKTSVVPIALYGSDLWNNMTTADGTVLDHTQHFIQQMTQCIHILTRLDTSESMLGCIDFVRKLEYESYYFLQ